MSAPQMGNSSYQILFMTSDIYHHFDSFFAYTSFSNKDMELLLLILEISFQDLSKKLKINLPAFLLTEIFPIFKETEWQFDTIH